jgi:hypothetical protein
MGANVFPTPFSGIQETLVDAKGDLIAATAADTPARLAVGTTEHRLVAASGEATGLKYVADTTNYAVAAKGDLLVGTAADTLAALTVGANGTTLVADSAEATGLKWQSASAGSANWSLLNAGGTALTGAQTITVSGISGKDKILILISGASSVNAATQIGVRLNTDTGSNYYIYGVREVWDTTYGSSNFAGYELTSTRFPIGNTDTSASNVVHGSCLITGCDSAGVKVISGDGGGTGGNGGQGFMYNGYYNSATVISSISIFSTTANLDAGTVYVYTSA